MCDVVKSHFGKSLLVLIMLMVLSVGVAQASEGKLPLHSGDIDGDGIISMDDIYCYKDAVLANMGGEENPSCQAFSDEEVDMQCNGSLNVTDVQRAILVYRYLSAPNDFVKSQAGELLVSYDEDLDMVHDDCEEKISAPWPMFGQNPQHTGKSPYAGPLMATVKWVFNSGELPIVSSVIVDENGIIYFGTWDKLFIALNPDGTLKWQKTLNGIVPSTPALSEDGVLYVVTRDKPNTSFQALNSETGDFVWEDSLNFSDLSYCKFLAAVSSPVIAEDGKIVLGSLDGNLYVVSPDGAVEWSFNSGSCIQSSPAIGVDEDGDGYLIYFGANAAPTGLNGTFYAFDQSGNQVWSFVTENPVNSNFSSDAVVGKGIIYVVHYPSDTLYALNAYDGSVVWTFYDENVSFSKNSGALDGDVYYLGPLTTSKFLYSLNAYSGELLWTYPVEGSINSNPTTDVLGHVYFATALPSGGFVYAVDSKGALIWKYFIEEAFGISNSISLGGDGTIYVTTHSGKVYAFQDPVEVLE